MSKEDKIAKRRAYEKAYWSLHDNFKNQIFDFLQKNCMKF